MNGRRLGLEMTELLLLLGINNPHQLSDDLKAAILVGHTSITSQTGWHTDFLDLKRLVLFQCSDLKQDQNNTDADGNT